MDDVLPAAASVLAVCAHPDDESFGLGAVLHGFATSGSDVSVLCFTRGEASTLGSDDAELPQVRADELARAAAVLGVRRVELLDFPDGDLTSVPLHTLADVVGRLAEQVAAEMLVVFDDSGVTGHADHRRATEAALAGAADLPVLAWCVTAEIAEDLNRSLGTRFAGRPDDEVDVSIVVDREVQRRAIACHRTQSEDNPVLRRRLERQGDREALHWLRPSGQGGPDLAADWDARYAAAPRLFRAEADETLVQLVTPLETGSALDVGAGEGRNALWLAAQGWDVTALDVSGVALERLGHAAADASLEVRGVQADAHAWLSAAARHEERFDLVVVSFLHPEPVARRALLAGAAAVVRPGGHLFVVAHHRDALGVVGPPDPERLYTEDDLRDATAGLEVLRLFRRTGPNDTGTEGADVVLWAGAPA